MIHWDIDKADRPLRLATDPGAMDGERQAAAAALCRMLSDNDVFGSLRKAVSLLETLLARTRHAG